MQGSKKLQKKEVSKPVIWLTAILVVAVIAGLIWVVLSLLLPPTGEITAEDVGVFHVVNSEGEEAKFAEATVYKKNGVELEEKPELLPDSYQSEVDFSTLDDEFYIAFDGKVEPNQVFEVYAETSGYTECISKPNFVVPEEDGKYLVKLTATWQKGENKQINEYIFGIIKDGHSH